MTERLIIRNFAGLDIDVELGRINIFIGPQASGKSICIKCAHFLKGSIYNLIDRVVTEGSDLAEAKNYVLTAFTGLFELPKDINKLALRHIINDEFIEITGISGALELNLSKFYQDLLNNARNDSEQPVIPEKYLAHYERIVNHFKKIVTAKVGPFGASHQWFIPASRAVYSLIGEPGSPEDFSNDTILSTFRVFYNALKRSQNLYKIEDKLVNDLSQQIIRADFSFDNEGEYLTHKTGERLPLIYASSGQQEILPVVTVLRYLAWPRMKEPRVIYIEEPEAHLHPSAQDVVTKLVAAVFNTSKSTLQFFLTTHTPYLLTAFNNLIYAGQLAEALKDDAAGLAKLDAVVPKELRLKLADFRVYGLENGRATLMIDEETGLLRADSIDSVSDVTADQFGDLMALDPAIHS